jgi:CheY-like chemotaxis protein
VVDLSDVLTELRELVEPSLPSAIRFQTTIEGKNLLARVDPGQLENALLNLCLNARSAIDDARKGNGGQIHLMMRSVELDPLQAGRVNLSAGRYIEISCEDDGAGMSSNMQKQIFDPFFSTRGGAGGTGLGLSMAQSFVEMSKGHIGVQSELGKGTVFTILIPAAQKLDAQPNPITDEFIADFTGQVALLVEDQEEVRNVLRRDLIDIGYSVLEAENGDEAQTLLSSVEGIDLLLTDVSMPGTLNGVQLAQFAAKSFPQTQIVLMTGQAKIEHDQSIKHPLLRKPFERHRLLEAIRHAGILTRKDKSEE